MLFKFSFWHTIFKYASILSAALSTILNHCIYYGGNASDLYTDSPQTYLTPTYVCLYWLSISWMVQRSIQWLSKINWCHVFPVQKIVDGHLEAGCMRKTHTHFIHFYLKLNFYTTTYYNHCIYQASFDNNVFFLQSNW